MQGVFTGANLPLQLESFQIIAALGIFDFIDGPFLDSAGWFYDKTGWFGIIILMALENAVAPLPSEVVMPMAGWKLILEEGLSVWFVILAGFVGAFGNLVGSLIAYWVGMKGGRPFLNRYGKYVLISKSDLDRGDKFFEKHGDLTVFVARLIPLIRGVISFPAGVAGMNLWKFSIYSFIGALPWSIGLAWAGYKLGERWEDVAENLAPYELPIIGIVLLAIAWFVWHQVRELRSESAQSEPTGSD